jgi:hypothetical protein
MIRNGPYSHWPTPTLRQLQLHPPDVYFALLAVRQRDPLKHFRLRRITVDRLGQSQPNTPSFERAIRRYPIGSAKSLLT